MKRRSLHAARLTRAGVMAGLFVAHLSGANAPAAAGGPAAPLSVGVRAAVVAKPTAPTDNRDATGNERVYAILSVQLFPSEVKLVEPVDAHALLDEVCSQLDRHGFRPVEKGRKPDILLTIQYGRAWLNNPYFGGANDPQTVVGLSSLSAPNGSAGMLHTANRDVTGSWAELMSRMEHGTEAKLQEAGYEKLCIRIIAWRYFSDPKARAQQLWRTTMVLDDPDHRDLNTVAGEMLAAGAPYFGRAINEPEMKVAKPPPDGRVNLGMPVVVEPAGKPAPVAAVAAPAIAPVRAEATKQFNLAEGDAELALQAFSRQSGEEIIYPVEQIRSVRTNRVSGELTPRVALERMLDGTGLVAVQDEKTGALAVRMSHRQPQEL